MTSEKLKESNKLNSEIQSLISQKKTLLEIEVSVKNDLDLVISCNSRLIKVTEVISKQFALDIVCSTSKELDRLIVELERQFKEL